MTSPEFDTSYARLPARFYARATPETAPDPHLIRLNHKLAQKMGLDVAWLRGETGLAMLAGQKMPEGVEPIAMAYAGHQFGGWSPQLGDGRAVLLGEIVGPDGARRDIQLKGSGRTPFSRRGDGKSALGPVLREYIVSEAMAAYGVPTTRALAACTSGELVVRESNITGGILTRVAQSHIRIGTFQYFFARNDPDALQILSDYVIARHYPECENVADMLTAIVRKQATLIAKWLGLGFIHGVMNTDNVQIAGETLDYGPCAFMDVFHPEKVFSSIDHYGRYAWGKQPSIALWNLTQLAHALSPILSRDESEAAQLAEQALAEFYPAFQAEMDIVFAGKFGFPVGNIDKFLQQTFSVMRLQKTDFTLFFRRLTRIAGGEDEAEFLALFAEEKPGQTWLAQWRERYDAKPENLAKMQTSNPIFIPRNHRIEQAITSALQNDFSPFHRLVDVLETPYTEQPEHSALEQPPYEDEIVTQTFCGT